MSPSAIDWQRLREGLQPDGALRDVYVLKADEQHWDRFLAALPRSPYRWQLTHGERSAAKPLSRFRDLQFRETNHALLRVTLAPDLVLACHFFSAEEIELDVVPNDLQSDDAVCMLIDFMRWLGQVVDRPVVLTHENRREDVILRIESTGT
ncbi:MAG TPA: hypothetical protein VGN72_22910 [Tepidisphaeraceae bacterium]|jgi:hypothetical protein|nr:hypothetical protein [Tepidisphaeraceae bacterium]